MSTPGIEKARSLGARKGMIMHLGLIVLVIFGSAVLAWLYQRSPQRVQAANTTQVATTKEPEGVAQDGTNVWVAEPGCIEEATGRRGRMSMKCASGTGGIATSRSR